MYLSRQMVFRYANIRCFPVDDLGGKCGFHQNPEILSQPFHVRNPWISRETHKKLLTSATCSPSKFTSAAACAFQ